MAFAERVLAVKLVSDVSGIAKDMKTAGTRMERAQARMKGWTSSAKSWGKAVGGALVISGVERLVGAVGEGVTAFREEEESVRQFRRTIANLGKPVGRAQRALDRIAERAVNLGFDDGDVIRGMDTFVKQTKSIQQSQELMGLAMDVSRSRQIPLTDAIKVAQGVYNGSARALRAYGIEGKSGMEAVTEARRKERGRAREWARNHPMEVLFGKISDGFADIVGSLAKGDFEGALQAGQKLVDNVVKGVLGYTDKNGRRVAGLWDRLFDATPDATGAPKGIINRLGKGILDAFAKVDWAATAGAVVSGIGTAISGLLASGSTPELLAAGTAIAGAIFVIGSFTKVATSLFGLPAWGAKTITAAAGKALGLTLRAAMFAVDLFITAAKLIFAKMGASTALMNAAGAVGTKLGAKMGGRMNVGFLGKLGLLGLGIETAVAGITWLGEQVPAENRLGYSLRAAASTARKRGGARVTRAWLENELKRLYPDATAAEIADALKYVGFARGTAGASRGWHVVGERGPELVRFRGGEQVLGARATRDAMGGGDTYNVSVQAGVGDPVAIGRQVDSVLRRYRRQAGLAYS